MGLWIWIPGLAARIHICREAARHHPRLASGLLPRPGPALGRGPERPWVHAAAGPRVGQAEAWCRLPGDDLAIALDQVLRREPPLPLVWVKATTPAGLVHAFAFAFVLPRGARVRLNDEFWPMP